MDDAGGGCLFLFRNQMLVVVVSGSGSGSIW